MMTLTRSKPTTKGSRHTGHDAGDPEQPVDPAILCARLRELAQEAHRAVRAPDDPDRRLPVLHARIVRLQQALHGQGLGGLASYVAALRLKVEDRLG